MPSYRIYRLDQGKHVLEVDWLTASSDDEAVAAARAMKNRGRREVWRGERLIATIHVATTDESSEAFWL